MLRWIARASFFFTLTLAASFVLAQTEFSADIVDSQKQGTPTQAKIYFAKDNFASSRKPLAAEVRSS